MGPAKCKSIPKRQNYDSLSVDEANSDPRKIISIQELEVGDVTFGKTFESQIVKWPISECNRMGVGKISKSEIDRNSSKISQKDKGLFEMDRFKDKRMQKFGIESKSSERGLESDVNMSEKMEQSEEKIDIDRNGWDDWDLEYTGKDGNGNETLGENQKPTRLLTSGEQSRITINSKSKVNISLF